MRARAISKGSSTWSA